MKRLWLGLALNVLLVGSAHAQFFGGGTGGSGGAGDVGSISASTATNPSTETQLKELTLTSGALNSANKKLMVHASGRYTTAAAQTPTLRFRVYLCTVSGCGSGTVLTLNDFTTAATTASTTNSWKIEGSIGTITTGATGTVESKWWEQVQLGAAGNLTPETRLDQNNAASASIDLTGVLYVRITALMSTADAGNSVVARMAWVDGGAGLGGGATGLISADLDTCAEFAAIMGGETGTCGSVVLSQAPTIVDATLTNPNIGTPSAGTLTNATGLPISTGVSGLGANVAAFLATPSSANLAAAVTGETGSGAAVFGTAPTLDSPTITTKMNPPSVTAFPGSPTTGDVVIVTDDTSIGACNSSAGSSVSLCRWNGSAWVSLGDGGGGGSIGGTVGTTDNAVPRADGTGGSTLQASGCTISDTILLTCPGGFAAGSASVGILELLEGTAPGAHATTSWHNCYIDSTTSRFACHENGGSVKDYVTAADTQTLTNKTADCTTAGNVCTIYRYIQLDLVGVAGGTAGHIWNDDPLSTTCTPASTVGTNQTVAFCTFPDSDGEYGKQLTLELPTGYVAASLQYRVKWKTTGTGNFRPRLQTICYASDAAGDSAYSNSTYITAGAGTSGRFNKTAWTSATDTGCDAEESMRIRLSRNRTEASDTLNAAADIESIEVRYAVAQ